MGRTQHISIFPTAAQTFTKSVMLVGIVGGVSQSRSATPRTSTSQQSGVSRPDEQRPAWRSTLLAGIARELAKRPLRVKRVMNEVLIFAVRLRILKGMLVL